MQRIDSESDSAAAALERRWFASIAAVNALQSECDVLRGVVETAEDAWRVARGRLAHLEALRDALGEELAEREVRTMRSEWIDLEWRIAAGE